MRDELAGTGAPAEAPQTAELEAQIETLRGEIAALRSEREAKGGTSSEGAEKPAESDSGGAAAPQDQQQLKEAGEEAVEKSQDEHK